MPDSPTPAATQSLHGPFLEKAIPTWLSDASTAQRQALKAADGPLPAWYASATVAQRSAVDDATVANLTAHTTLDKAFAAFKGIDDFAEPLLVKALKDQFKVELDVKTTQLRLKKNLEVGVLKVGSFEVLRLPLLQAALHNFEAAEADAGAFHESSGFITPSAVAVSTTLTVVQFIALCRSLDIGSQYQAYLKNFFHPADAGAENALRDPYITAQKAALRASAELALLKKDIEPADYSMLLSVIAGDINPTVNGKPVWFDDLSLMRHRMTGCVVFSVSEKYRYSDELILYIPNEPQTPLKRYTVAQMRAWFKATFTQRDADEPAPGNPTSYQRFFSRFVAYGDQADYFNQFTEAGPSTSFSEKVLPYVSLLNELNKGINPFSSFTTIKEFPPVVPAPRIANPDPYLAPASIARKGRGIWAANIDLWSYLFDRHREQLIADARNHAVPTADVDARVRSEKFAALLNIGMLVLGGVSMFVPVLGEVMMGVMAWQLLHETLAGAVEWGEGDRKAAKAHLVDVAENLALIAVMAGVGKGYATFKAAKAPPLIEQLEPVVMPGGQTRLWKPSLRRYVSPVSLEHSAGPNALGLHEVDGKTCIRHDGSVYETRFDATLNRWRIQHPTDAQAYQPLLAHNGAGAWRHSLDRPLTWDRLTLLRRMGHVTEPFGDPQLLQIADISGVSDDALRKMHADNALPPPELSDALRLYRADQGVSRVIEQVESGRAVDEHYLYVLPLVTEMPRWPAGRVLEVFDGPGLTGRSVKYGKRSFTAMEPIRISRAEVLDGQLSTQILASLDEDEVLGLLGGEPARVRDARAEEFNKQIADYARTRQPAIFDSLYAGTEPPPPRVAKLRRLYPGLSEPAARAVLADADSEQLTRLDASGRVPLAMQEQARWYVREGRLGQAYAGLHMDNLTSADSKRLALHSLAKLPGWSDQVRLEVRDGDIGGTLLDAIGDADAATRKYLVKKGPTYQAFNERGEELNSVARHGDNFYASLMHALPDQARQALGMPHVGQSLSLRQAIIDYAADHRLESMQVLEGRTRRQPFFKPPRRISPTRIGYPASGRGMGGWDLLVTRVQNVYPQLTDDQANGFIASQLVAGQSEQQVFDLLNNRLREWHALEATLDQWVGMDPVTPASFFQMDLGSRRAAAQALKACWRAAPLATLPRFAELRLYCHTPLPPLEADFSHVRSLELSGGAFTSATIAPILGHVPKLEKLVLGGVTSPLPLSMQALPELIDLNIIAKLPLTPEDIARVGSLSKLQALSLYGALPRGHVLDVSTFPELRRLRLSNTVESGFPLGVFDLKRLERLDFSDCDIATLPTRLFEPGHEQLWKGLSMNWSRFSREQFIPAFDYVNSQPVHLMDANAMARGYYRGALGRLHVQSGRADLFGQMQQPHPDLLRAFEARWPDMQARVNAVNALSEDFDALTEQLLLCEQQDRAGAHYRVILPLRRAWYDGVLAQYDVGTARSVLTLPELGEMDMPSLSAEGFAHITTLHIDNWRSPAPRMRGFISSFKGVRTLQLRSCAVDAWPMQPGDLPLLENLDLSRCPLTTLDVSQMTSLRALSLQESSVQTWPEGAHTLPSLEWLDLRNTHITSLPPSFLAQHDLLINTNLHGAPLTPQSQAALAAALRRVEHTRGLPIHALDGFALQEIPAEFPPKESGTSIARQLLPLLAPEPPGGLSLEQRLQAFYPTLEANEPGQWLAQLRASGASDAQVHERLDAWRLTVDALTRRLNDWLFIREHRGTGWEVSSHTRRLAALRLTESWRAGLWLERGAAQTVLDLNGLQVGDLPALPVSFAHVETLNLSGVRLSEDGSEAFLRSCTRVRRLVLNGNLLLELPESVGGMSQLEHLEVSSNGLHDAGPLTRTLAGFEALQSLDLGNNNLSLFNVTGMQRLEALDLSNNRLREWPSGVLEAPRLRRLNLSNNDIEDIEAAAFDGSHDALLAGTDVDDNHLSRATLERLSNYAQRTGRDHVLGMPVSTVEQMLDSDPEISSEGEAAESDEELPEAPAVGQQSGRWVETLAPQDAAQFQALWNQLAAEPGNEAFFHLLERLGDTQEFSAARADLTRRVQAVLKAAASNTELRQTVFALSSTHGTCVDGRILTFSNLEVKVFEYNALLTVDPGNLEQKGAALLKLSRQLFRLDLVEQLASRAMLPLSDPAEVRLEYRIGLKDALELPGQPQYMSFSRPIFGPAQQEALAKVRAAEASVEFYENLISRDYWVDYLKEKYPEPFSQLEQAASERHDQMEVAHTSFDQAYSEALNRLEIERATERNQLLIRLSRQEAPVPDPPIAGTSTAQNRK